MEWNRAICRVLQDHLPIIWYVTLSLLKQSLTTLFFGETYRVSVLNIDRRLCYICIYIYIHIILHTRTFMHYILLGQVRTNTQSNSGHIYGYIEDYTYTRVVITCTREQNIYNLISGNGLSAILYVGKEIEGCLCNCTLLSIQSALRV